jgi:hypothetical protein
MRQIPKDLTNKSPPDKQWYVQRTIKNIHILPRATHQHHSTTTAPTYHIGTTGMCHKDRFVVQPRS